LGDELCPRLNKLGVYAEVVPAYRLSVPEVGGAEAIAELREETFSYVIFNGASSVENLAALVEPQTLSVLLREAHVLCSNEEACAAAQAHGLTVHLRPSESSVSGLVRVLREDCLNGHVD
jgi:uroporphyrinogen-III synthase